MDQRVQELGRLDKGVSPAIVKSTKRHIAWLEKEIARLDREYQAALQRSAPLAQRASLYRTVPGIGPLTAAILVSHLPELGQWDSKALTSLVGLAPGLGTAAESGDNGPSEAAAASCVARCTSVPGQPSGSMASCAVSIRTCVNAGNPAKWRWWR